MAPIRMVNADRNATQGNGATDAQDQPRRKGRPTCRICNLRTHNRENCNTPPELWKCGKCNKVGHGKKECPGKEVVCAFCHTRGHGYDTCPDREKYIPAQCPTPRKCVRTLCGGCRKTGHMAEECPVKDSWQCLNCEEFGHYYATCELGIQPGKKKFCFLCEERGHMHKGCPKRWFHRCPCHRKLGGPSFEEGSVETSSASNSDPGEGPQAAVLAADYAETVRFCTCRSEGDALQIQDAMEFRESAEESIEPCAPGVAQQAASYFSRGQYNEVIVLITGELDISPTSSDLYIYRAMACTYSKDYSQSLRDLWTACQGQGHSKYAWGCLLAYLKRVMERGVGDVSQHFTFVATSETYHLQALVSFLAGEIDLACTHVNTALRQDRSNADARSLRWRILDLKQSLYHGQAYFNNGDFQYAVEEYNRALGIIGSSEQEYSGGLCRVHFLLYRANANLKLLRLPACWDDVDEIMALNPAYPEAYTFRGVLNRAVGRRRQAEADLAFATALQTGDRAIEMAGAATDPPLSPSDIRCQAPAIVNGSSQTSQGSWTCGVTNSCVPSSD